MKAETWFRKKLESFKDDFEFRLESLILDITDNICREMEHSEINRVELAERLNVSPPAVTKILNGNSNFTLKTLLSISDALGLDLKIDFRKKRLMPFDKLIHSVQLVSLLLESGNLKSHHLNLLPWHLLLLFLLNLDMNP